MLEIEWIMKIFRINDDENVREISIGDFFKPAFAEFFGSFLFSLLSKY